LKIGQIFASFQLEGSLPDRKDFLNRIARAGARLSAKLDRIEAGRLSGPEDEPGFRLLSSLRTSVSVN
jgi:hypothetical protein